MTAAVLISLTADNLRQEMPRRPGAMSTDAHAIADAWVDVGPATAPRLENGEYMGYYDLNRMGWQQFEHMVQALAKAELGNGVRPFGAGKDGQRDATFEGPIPFPVGSSSTWNGYGVIQVKHQEKSTTATADWRWFIDEVRGELRGWVAKKRLGKKTPAYLLFATNVALSGTEGTGGKDQFELLMSNAASDLGLRGWYVWDYAEIRTMLDSHTSIRQRYLESIVTGDFLVQLESLLPKKTALEVDRLAVHAVAELITRQWVRTGDAGYSDTSKVRLADIAIDLPCRWPREADRRGRVRRGAARVTLGVGDRTLSSLGSTGPRGVVLVGGPGQGKSTIAQVIAHAYRVAFLRDTDITRFGENARLAFEGLSARLEAAGIPVPERRRWPIVVELAKAGTMIARHEGPFSLLKYIADGIVVEGQSADPGALLDWMKSWPCCLVLDGLDEVPDAKIRTRLIDAISAFVSELSAHRADVFVVATTRPQGYRGEFGDALPCDQLELLEFTEREALSYSEALTSVRTSEDPDLAAQVTERLLTAVHERVTQRLMTTPLQVTIMTALAEEAVELPTDRFELFDRYYKVVYERELAKSEAFAELKTLRQHIDHLHEQAGIKLQARTEQPGNSDALLTKAEIARILRRRLTTAGFDEAESETIAEKLLRLSTERVVMLVSRRPTKFEFEVRSLQEYMAARALTDGDDETVLGGLRRLLPSSHWRNTWLLAAGRLLKRREHLSDEVVQMVTDYDASSPEASVTALGASLAGDLYLDNLGAEFPAVRRALLKSGMTQFRDTALEVSRTLDDLVEQALAQDGREPSLALASLHEVSRENPANLATKYLSEHSSGMTALAKQARATLTEGRKYIKPSSHPTRTRAQHLAQHLAKVGATVPEALVLVERLNEETVAAGSSSTAAASVGILQALDQPEARSQLAAAIKSMTQSQPDAAHFGTALLRQHASRTLRGQTYAR